MPSGAGGNVWPPAPVPAPVVSAEYLRRTPPRVSVVLPVRNGGRSLPAALASIQAQSDPNWELIVVDDGSTDDTPARLRAAARHDPRIRVFTLAPSGIVAALTLGLAKARAPLIARLDSDDVAHARRLELQGAFLESHPHIGLDSCRVEFGGDERAAGGYRRHVEWLNTVMAPNEIWRSRFIESPLAHPSVVFRRELVTQFGGYREGDFPEDYELWLRWLEAGVVMAKVPETLLTWNDSSARLSRTCPRYSVEAFYRLKARYLSRWLRKQLPASRPVWIWGAGRVTRTRVRWLLDHGVDPAGWIDIDPRKVGRTHAGRPVRAPESLRSFSSETQGRRPFVLVYVGSWEAREIITAWLKENGFGEETDYLVCA